MSYSFNIGVIIKKLVPNVVRLPKMLAWLMTYTKPSQGLHTAFTGFRLQTLKDITITSQVNRLTQALQDKFNNPGIYLVHPYDYLDAAYFYLFNEQHLPEFDYLFAENHAPVDYDYLFNEYDPDVDFIVMVPIALALSADAIYAFTAKYVMAGRRFKVQTY